MVKFICPAVTHLPSPWKLRPEKIWPVRSEANITVPLARWSFSLCIMIAKHTRGSVHKDMKRRAHFQVLSWSGSFRDHKFSMGQGEHGPSLVTQGQTPSRSEVHRCSQMNYQIRTKPTVFDSLHVYLPCVKYIILEPEML